MIILSFIMKYKNSATQTVVQSPAIPQEDLFKRLIIDVIIILIQAIIGIYTLISTPYFYFKYQIAERKRLIEDVKYSEQFKPGQPNSVWRQLHIEPEHYELERDVDSFKNYDQLMRTTLKRYAKKPCYGYRKVLHEQWVKRSDSDKKLQRQVKLSDYKWCTYEQMDRQIEAARRGFLLSGIRAGHNVMIYADTRPEWQISSQALIRLGATVATMYATLGVDGIVHSVNETQVTHLVTQRDKVNKLLRLKSRLPKLAKIIYFENTLDMPNELGGDEDDDVEDEQKIKNLNKEWQTFQESEIEPVDCIPFKQLVIDGLKAKQQDIDRLDELDRPIIEAVNKDSTAVIMYTSGSTGIPKGVLVTHGNVMATTKAFSWVTKDFCRQPDKHVCTAYLPLAHIFEFALESMMLYHGVKFGFATPHTLTDKSPGLMAGEKGDFTLLKPTVTIIVPLILDRVVQGIKQVLKASGYFKFRLVNYLIKYKMYWQRNHYPTPLIDKIICSKISAALGGRVVYCICGSAPLSPETQAFVRAAMNMKLPQGFGSTETSASATCQRFDDQSTGNVGVPNAGCLIKLEPWLEGNYRPCDKPNPRGEIVVGGEMVAAGYYKLDHLTSESFYTDEKGVRWYRTGDIGEFLPNGNLKIIDRKKDLVKLQNGEFISLGRIESTLKSNQFTDNFCAYVNSRHNFVVALGPANQLAIRKLARELIDKFDTNQLDVDGEPKLDVTGKARQEAIDELKQILQDYDDDPGANEQYVSTERKMSTLSTNSQANYDDRLKSLCDNALVHDYILKQISALAQERQLTSLETPKRILLLAEEWTEDKNLVTAALKIRRNYIYKRYERELEQLYSKPK